MPASSITNIVPEIGSIKLDGTVVSLDYYLSGEYEIDRACAELPAIIEWINARLQEVQEEKLLTILELKRMEAKVYFELKAGKFQALYVGNPTEIALSHALSLDVRVEKISNKCAKLNGWAQRLRGIISSLETKLDLVRSAEATRRKVYTEEDQD